MNTARTSTGIIKLYVWNRFLFFKKVTIFDLLCEISWVDSRNDRLLSYAVIHKQQEMCLSLLNNEEFNKIPVSKDGSFVILSK